MKPKGLAVITGGSAGVGRAAALEFARSGYAVGLIARGEQRLQAAEREIAVLGARVLAIAADVADPDQVESAAERFERALGPVEVWVNNAMCTVFSEFLDVTPDEFKRATEVTYLGTVYGTLAALKRMRARDRGVIVQVGSALSYRAIPLQAPYCGAKHAVRGFTDSLRSELMRARSKVRLTMVQLPALNTPQFDWCRNKLSSRSQPVPPIFQPEVAARAIVWAARHRRRELYVGWPVWKAIWASKLVPGLADRYLSAFGYDSQQTGEGLGAERRDNLFQPVPGSFGAHGRFDRAATSRSPALWFAMHRNQIFWAAAALLAGAAAIRAF